MVTAYALAFGGLLLLGGRIADYAGRKQVFVPIALAAAVFAHRLMKESRAAGSAHYDIPGALTVTLGLVSLA